MIFRIFGYNTRPLGESPSSIKQKTDMFNMQSSNPHNVTVTIHIHSPLSRNINTVYFQGKVISFCFVSWLGLAVNTRVSPDEGKTISSWDEMIKWVPGMRVKISYTDLLTAPNSPALSVRSLWSVLEVPSWPNLVHKCQNYTYASSKRTL